MDYAQTLAGIAAVQFFAAASPGPNFIIVSNYSISRSRRYGLLAVCGILAASATWALMAALGLGVLLATHPHVYAAMQYASAAYLIWLGGKILLGAVRKNCGKPAATDLDRLTAWEAVRAGFLTNMTNPKSVAYYSSLFVVMIPPDAPLDLFAASVGVALLVSALWWVSVAAFFGVRVVRGAYERSRRAIDVLMGGLLVALGVRIAVFR
ncbi:LysE family translocator [Salinarimonas sp.]|uniref:LysE family translocator n=1 Tax=Salinarimonas sp. TaxID=2766526 RepID=UPI0032D9AAA6